MSGKTLKEIDGGDVATHVADIVYHGDQLTLPIGMDIDSAVDLLRRRQKFLDEKITISETYNVFPFDGALALDHALTEKWGWAPAVAKPGFFGPTPPRMINVRTGPDQKDVARVVWGMFKMPSIEGHMETNISQGEGSYQFVLNATVKRKDEATVQEIFNMVRERLKKHSIYRGKAVKIRFLDDNGNSIAMPEPEFIDTRSIQADQLIFSDSVAAAIDTNLFTPICRVADCIANNIPIKRGVLLGGTYGTGKTLAAFIAAKYAVDHGVTYVYIPKANELANAIEFAKQYQSPACVIFCEDVDRVMSGIRDEDTDEILNLIDGIDTKSCNVIVVLTTNEIESVEPAMLRPGRLDAVIEVTPPDAGAVERLLRFYGGRSIKKTTDLTQAAALLAGHIPAVVAEVVNRAKLAQLRMQVVGQKLETISEEALIESAGTMRQQLELLASRIAPKTPTNLTIEHLIGEVFKSGMGDIEDRFDALKKQISDVRARV